MSFSLPDLGRGSNGAASIRQLIFCLSGCKLTNAATKKRNNKEQKDCKVDTISPNQSSLFSGDGWEKEQVETTKKWTPAGFCTSSNAFHHLHKCMPKK